jgi:hypothetical protein
MNLKFTIPLLILFASCRSDDPYAEAGPGGWLKGSTQEKFETVASQLRGFDMAMVETDYRYQELYWAGKDQNWEYAGYQLQKIKLAVENGLERRPKRAESAQHFLNYVLPEMNNILDKKDTVEFLKGFEMLTANCNACHAMEKVPFFTVQIPNARQSSIRTASLSN